MKKFLTSFIVSVILFSCKSGSDSQQSVLLHGDSIPYPEDFFGKSVGLHASDTFYFNSGDKAYNNLVVMISSDNEIITIDTLLKIGEGPNEILEGELFKGGDEKVYAFVKSSNRPIYVKEINLNVDPKNWREIRNDSLQGFFTLGRGRNTVITPDSMILFVGGAYPGVKGIFSLMDMKDGSIKGIEYFPDDGINCDLRTKGLVYRNNAYLVDNNSGKYLYALGANKFAFIFHLENDRVVIDKWLFDEYPDYRQTDEIGNFKWNPEIENLAIAATEKYIYMLTKNLDINGKEAEQYRDVLNGNHIYVYDWTGTKVASYDLDTYGYSIFVDNKGETLYLQQMNGISGDYSLRKYTLPKN